MYPILCHPIPPFILIMSFYLKKNKDEYYRLLMDVRLKGDWESWLKFFLKGVIEVSRESVSTIREIITLKESLTGRILSEQISGTLAIKLLGRLFEKPIVSTADIVTYLDITRQAASL
jgi:Fic family protein